MEVSSSSGEFSGRVYLNRVGQAHDSHQCPFFQYLAAAHTGALGDMFFPGSTFCHLDLNTPIIFPF